MTDQQQTESGPKSLYQITGDIADINTILVNRGEFHRLQVDLERERMRLFACGVVAMADTPDSARDARAMHPDYESASCDDVKRRVDECIELRARVSELEVQLESIGAGGVGPLMKGTHREQHLDMVPLPRSVVEQVFYHLIRGDADAVCWADGVIKPALEQPQRKRFADECINLVAFHGGSVEIEAAIRAMGQA